MPLEVGFENLKSHVMSVAVYCLLEVQDVNTWLAALTVPLAFMAMASSPCGRLSS